MLYSARVLHPGRWIPVNLMRAALTTRCVYPTGLVLSNVLAGLFPACMRRGCLKGTKGYVRFCRLCAILPPLALAAAMHSLPASLQRAGWQWRGVVCFLAQAYRVCRILH